MLILSDHLVIFGSKIEQKCNILIDLHTVSSNGRVQYSEVIELLQKDRNMVTKYMSITTVCNKSLALSATHQVYARKYSGDEFSTM